MNTLGVDYHFHPNISFLPKKKISRKIQKIYQRFLSLDISAVICTEHVYKNPRKAYTMMRRYQPDGMHVFPGMEYITREKIDIIIFSHSPSLYNYPQLKPFAMTYQETVDFVNAHDDVYAFVTHPFSFSAAGIVKRRGIHFMKTMIEQLSAVEIEYHVFDSLVNRFKKIPGFHRFFGRLLRCLELNQRIPDEYCPENMHFYAAGSDAHHVFEIGTHCRMYCDDLSLRMAVFNAVISNVHPEVVWIHQRRGGLSFLRTLLTVSGESLLKKRYFFVKKRHRKIMNYSLR